MARFKDPNTGKEEVAPSFAIKIALSKGYQPMDQDAITKSREIGYTGPTFLESSEQKFVSEGLENFPQYPELQPLGSTPFEQILPEEYQLQSPESLMPFLQEQLMPAQESLSQLRDYATSSEMSPFAKAQLERQGVEEALARDVIPQNVAGDIATARSSLAMRGGLEGGAAERLATQGLRASQTGLQNVAGEGRLARLGIGESEAGRKFDIFTGLPTAEFQLASPFIQQGQREQEYGYNTNKFNIDSVMQERQRARESQLGGYQAGLDRAKLEAALKGSFRTAATQPGAPTTSLTYGGIE